MKACSRARSLRAAWRQAKRGQHFAVEAARKLGHTIDSEFKGAANVFRMHSLLP